MRGGSRPLRAALAAAGVLLAPAAFALGTLELGLTAGPDAFLERSAYLRVEPWAALAGEAEAAFSDGEGSGLTEFYRVGALVRTPLQVDLGAGATRSPPSEGVKSSSVYGLASVALPPAPGRWDFATAVTVTGERQTYSFRPLDRWVEVDQTAWGLEVAQTLLGALVLMAEYRCYTYDQDLDRAARALIVAGLRRPESNLLFTADRVTSLPDRVWGVGARVHATKRLTLGASYSRIEAAVERFGVDEDRYGGVVEFDLTPALGADLGVDLYRGGGESAAYTSLRLRYSF